jgi:hypothetical protein
VAGNACGLPQDHRCGNGLAPDFRRRRFPPRLYAKDFTPLTINRRLMHLEHPVGHATVKVCDLEGETGRMIGGSAN